MKKDTGAVLNIPLIDTLLREQTHPHDTSAGKKSMEACKYHETIKQQGVFAWEVKFDVTNPNSLFSQMGKDNVNHGVLISAVIERVNYYSRWTSIYPEDWDELQREHCDKHTGFTPDAVPSTILWKQNFETFLLEIST